MAGPFVYYIVQEVSHILFTHFNYNFFDFQGCLDWNTFSNLHILSLLAHFILQAYVAMSRNRKAATLPLIVSAPRNIENGTCIVLGIPPLCENSPKKYGDTNFDFKHLIFILIFSFFGKAFEQAAERINCDANCDFFDTSCKFQFQMFWHLKITNFQMSSVKRFKFTVIIDV